MEKVRSQWLQFTAPLLYVSYCIMVSTRARHGRLTRSDIRCRSDAVHILKKGPCMDKDSAETWYKAWCKEYADRYVWDKWWSGRNEFGKVLTADLKKRELTFIQLAESCGLKSADIS